MIINSVGFPIFACIYLANNNKELVASISRLSITLEKIDNRLDLLERKVHNE